MDPTESTDFDFFDTPRNLKLHHSDEEGDKKNSHSHNSGSTEIRSNSDDVKNKKNTTEKRHSLSSLSESSAGDDDYSSDSVSSLSDNDQSEKTETKQSRSDRSYSSGSSVSSSYSDRRRDGKKSVKSRSRRRSRSNSRSDEYSDDDISKSKNTTSGSSNNTDRQLKSRMGYRDNKKSVTKNSSKSGRSKDEEEEYSSSAYSDGEESSHRFVESHSEHNDKKTKAKNRSNRNEAWGDESSSSKTNSKERPKTAKHRNGGRRKNSPQNSDSEALSDSDITDVSPIESPRSNGNRPITSLSRLGAAGDGENSKARFKALPLNEREMEDVDESQEDSSAGIDLKILMKAVGELEKKKRVEANSRRVMFAPMTLKRNDKSNYTFDKSRTHDIDRENDRLLKEIVKQVHADRKRQNIKAPAAPTKSKITPSAINREREMRRIESENINFLKRLQKVKPTSTCSRTTQLKEYENTKLHGIPIATLHPVSRASSRTSQFTDSYSSIGSRTRSMTSLHSIASTVRSTSSKRSSRPGSATKRADTRPDWNDRW